ncbi:MAG: hypothetical protein JRD89_10135 [Deltaproteobacteria bacterium]|nr:hypothetical protein [Deltaproteobacteria bacterium]
MEESLIAILTPLADKALQRLMTGGKVRGNDIMILVTLQMSRDISAMRGTMGNLNDTIHELKEAIGELRVEVAELKGRLA